MKDRYIEKVKRDTQGTPTSCKGCKYRKTLFGNRTACHFAIDTGELRGCDVANCSRYESGRRARKRPFHECVDDYYKKEHKQIRGSDKTMKPNEDVRKALAIAGLKQWELAEYLDITENKLSNMLARHELPKEEKEILLEVIEANAKNKSSI